MRFGSLLALLLSLLATPAAAQYTSALPVSREPVATGFNYVVVFSGAGEPDTKELLLVDGSGDPAAQLRAAALERLLKLNRLKAKNAPLPPLGVAIDLTPGVVVPPAPTPLEAYCGLVHRWAGLVSAVAHGITSATDDADALQIQVADGYKLDLAVCFVGAI